MILVLEGPDGSGKTTLAHELAQRYNLQYRHEGPPPREGSLLEYYGRKLQEIRERNEWVVLDRFAFGECIYGPIMRGEDRLGDVGWRLMRRLYRAAGAIEILCLPPRDVVVMNWTARRGLEYVQAPGKLHDVYDAYQNVTWMYRYNYMCDDLLFLDRVPIGRLPSTVYGSPTAQTLFVGERPGNAQGLDLAFFSTDESAGYFNDALYAANVDESQIALMNAYRGRDTVPQLIPRNYRRVVALGGLASRVCHAQALPHKKIYHPQYWRRFHHDDVDGYVRQLKEAML